VLVHCPEQYNQLEMEDVETGTRVVSSVTPRKSPDFFHSRLGANASGTRLISVGWIWHPFDAYQLFDLPKAMTDASELDKPVPAQGGPVEVTSAAFRDNDSLFVWCDADGDDFDEEEPDAKDAGRYRPGTIATYDLTANKFLTVAPVAEPAGRLMPLDREHVVGFHGHPRLIHAPSGRVIHEWSDITCGVHGSSIIHHLPAAPPVAMDSARRRFAVGGEQSIALVQIMNL
jgi:hypothetical protein